MSYLNILAEWSNVNSGFLSLVLFIVTIFLGWISGVFNSLRRKPLLKIEILSGPSFCASFDTGRVYNNHQMHRTVISVYLSIKNIGLAPTDIEYIHVGYKCKAFINPFKWLWIYQLTACKTDFIMSLGEDRKVYPFLMQKNQYIDNSTVTYLREGQKCNGVVYFEQDELFDNYIPSIVNNIMNIKLLIKDVYGRKYSTVGFIPKVTIEAARKVCEKFGETRESLLDQ